MTEPVLLILRHTEDENSWSNKQRRIEPEAILLKPRAYVYMLQLQCGADLRCLFGIIGNVSNREILIIDLCDQILVKVSIIKGQVLIILREN